MSDSELQQAERDQDHRRIAEIKRRLGEPDAQVLAAQFRAEIAEKEQENRNLGYKIKNNEERIAFLKKVATAILPEPCPSCEGRGRFREWAAQDESHIVACDRCKGTGFK